VKAASKHRPDLAGDVRERVVAHLQREHQVALRCFDLVGNVDAARVPER
jgi:hypothetical protein